MTILSYQLQFNLYFLAQRVLQIFSVYHQVQNSLPSIFGLFCFYVDFTVLECIYRYVHTVLIVVLEWGLSVDCLKEYRNNLSKKRLIINQTYIC